MTGLAESTAESGTRPPRPLPVVGHAPYYLRDRLGFLTRCAAAGPAVELELGGKTYLLTSPDDIKHVLAGNHGNYAKSARLTGARGRRLFGPGLGRRTGEDHRRHRLMRQPQFSHAVIAGFVDVIVDCTEDVLASWSTETEVDIAAESLRLAQSIILSIVFGQVTGPDIETALAARARFVERSLVSPFTFYDRVPTPTRRASRRAEPYLATFLEEQIAGRRARPEHDLLTRLVEARYEDGAAFPDEELRDEVLSLTITAREKISAALAWTLYLLGRNPDAGQKLVEELDAVLGGRRPTPSDLPRLEYAHMFVAESMRLYPPGWIVVRIARDADVLPSGAAIEAGAKIFISQFVVHHDSRWFPEPEVFDPGRFESRHGRPRLAYLPFGSGPRVCIGEGLARLEAVLVLASVASRFRLTPLSPEPARLDPRLSLRPKGRLMMGVSPRRA